MFEYYFFDLDGTLTDSSLGIINSYKYALTKLSLKVPEDSCLRKYIGPPLLEVFQKDYVMDKLEADNDIKFTGNIFLQREFLKIKYILE